MRELINFCYKGAEKQLLSVTKFDAAWTDNKNKFKITFGKTSFIIVFFSFGNLAFH